MPLKSTPRTRSVGASAPRWKLGSATNPASAQSNSRLARMSNAFCANVQSLQRVVISTPYRSPKGTSRILISVQWAVLAGVEDEGVALPCLQRAHFAGDDHVVAGGDHVAEVAGDPDQGVVD